MGIFKPGIHPGPDGLLDCVDAVNEVKSKISSLLTLALIAGSDLNQEETACLFSLIEDILAPVWDANDEVYRIYKEIKGKE